MNLTEDYDRFQVRPLEFFHSALIMSLAFRLLVAQRGWKQTGFQALFATAMRATAVV
jgi:hypothetical protein